MRQGLDDDEVRGGGGPRTARSRRRGGSWPAGDGGDEVGAATRASVASGRPHRGRGAGTADDRGGVGA